MALAKEFAPEAGARAAPRTRARRRRTAVRRARGGGAAGRAGGASRFVRDAPRADARRAARRRPWPGEPGSAVYVPARALAARGARTRRPRRRCSSCCGRSSRTRGARSSPRAASTTAILLCRAGPRLRGAGLRRPGRRRTCSTPAGAATRSRTWPLEFLGERPARHRRAHRGRRREARRSTRPPRPPPRRRTSPCAWPSPLTRAARGGGAVRHLRRRWSCRWSRCWRTWSGRA